MVPGTTLLPVLLALVSYTLPPVWDSWLPGQPVETSVAFFFKMQFVWCAAGIESPAVASTEQPVCLLPQQ